MTKKKSPRCMAAVGADQKGGKEFLASSDLATPARPAQAECCANCQFFRRVALPSGHDRKLCMMTGEKLSTAAGWCDLFAAGSWDETWADPDPAPLPKWLLRAAERLRALTHARCLGHGGVPQTVQGVTDAFTVPHTVKRAVFFSASNTREVYPLRGAIHWRKQRPGVRETPAALHWPGSVVSAFFCILNPPKQCRCFMHSIPLFRPASCGGRASLSFLLRKLARAGETAALVALLGTSLSTSARVRWAMLGNVLTVEEVRHAA